MLYYVYSLKFSYWDHRGSNGGTTDLLHYLGQKLGSPFSQAFAAHCRLAGWQKESAILPYLQKSTVEKSQSAITTWQQLKNLVEVYAFT